VAAVWFVVLPEEGHDAAWSWTFGRVMIVSVGSDVMVYPCRVVTVSSVPLTTSGAQVN
jgi:hypothetical protein